MKEIRTNPRFAQTRAVIVSANPQRVRQLKYEADDVLIKPMTFTRILNIATTLHPDNL